MKGEQVAESSACQASTLGSKGLPQVETQATVAPCPYVHSVARHPACMLNSKSMFWSHAQLFQAFATSTRESVVSCAPACAWCCGGLTVSALCLLCLLCSFGLVAIPTEMRVWLVVGAITVIALSFIWEHSLRQLFPAAKPPHKGYLVHRKEVTALLAQQARDKKGN